MTKPYTYLLKFIPENKFYYGVKYAKDCNPKDFWVKYFTSSNVVKELIEKYGKESFVFEIRKVFDDEKQARKWERKVIKRMNIVNDSRFLNKSCPREKFGFETGLNNPMNDQKSLKIMLINKKKTMMKKYGVEQSACLAWVKSAHSKAMSKTNSTLVECPHCNKKGGLINMKRYHFNNCKFNIKGEHYNATLG